MATRIKHAFVFDALGTLFQLTPLEEKLGGKASWTHGSSGCCTQPWR